MEENECITNEKQSMTVPEVAGIKFEIYLFIIFWSSE
jgi:hypothetical protein